MNVCCLSESTSEGMNEQMNEWMDGWMKFNPEKSIEEVAYFSSSRNLERFYREDRRFLQRNSNTCLY